MDDVAEAHASNTPDVILPAPGPIAPIGMPSDDTAQRVAREGGVGGEPADSEVLSMGDVLAKAEAVVGVFERVAQLEGTAHHADTRVHAGDVTRANMPPEPASKREDLSECVHHKVHGGSVALEGIASRELDFFSGLIVKYISDALSEWTHGGNRGEVNLKLEVKANVQADAQPVAFQMHLAGERVACDESCRQLQSPQRLSGLSTQQSYPLIPKSSRKNGSPGTHQLPNTGTMSPRRLQSPRWAYDPANRDPQWGMRHQVDLNTHQGSLGDYTPGQDVPTLKAHTLVRPGTNADWTIRILRQGTKNASRFGVVGSHCLAKQDWYSDNCMHAAWYMTSHGLFNGASLYEEANVKLKANDVVKLHLSWTPNHRGTLRFTLNGQHVAGEIGGIQGSVHLACQLLNKGDLIALVREELDGAQFGKEELKRRGGGQVGWMPSGRLADASLELWSPDAGFETKRGFFSNDLLGESLISASRAITEEMSEGGAKTETVPAVPSTREDSSGKCLVTIPTANPGAEIRVGNVCEGIEPGNRPEEDKHLAGGAGKGDKGCNDDVDYDAGPRAACDRPAKESSMRPVTGENIKNSLMGDVNMLEAELRAVMTERDGLRQEAHRGLMLHAEKNLEVQRLEDRVASLEAAVHERTLQNDHLINDLSQKAVLHQSVSKELESTRAHLADRIRVAAHLQHQLRERTNGKMQGQADFDQNWQELLLDQKRGKAAVGRVKSLMLKTDQRNLSGSGGVEGQKSRHACVGTKMSRHASRDGSGTGLRSDGSVALTKEMFNMRPRVDSKRPMSAPSTGRRAPQEHQLTKEHGKMLKMVRTKPHGNFSSSQKATAEEALLEAAIENDSDAVLLMLSLVRDERRNKSLASHALAIAAKNGSEAVCRGLMDACGALDTDSAIFRAAQSGHIKILEFLVERGGRVTAVDDDGATPLILAAFHGQVEGVRKLLSLGSNIDDADHDGYTALMWSAFKGRVDTSLALMEAGADVNAQSGEGNSALTYAAYSGSRVLVEAMLEQAKDPKACNKLGMSAADVADQQGHHEVGKLLRGDETG